MSDTKTRKLNILCTSNGPLRSEKSVAIQVGVGVHKAS